MNLPISRVAFRLLTCVLLCSLSAAQSITGHVQSSTGAPVTGVNIDGFDTDGNEIDLANDGTDVNGNFTTTLIAPAGVYTFVFYPPAPPTTTHLVAERPNVVVVTTTDLGTITLGAGVLLSGRTVRSGSIPVANVTLTVLDGPNGDLVLQVQTKTNAFGNFNLAVPAHAIEFQLNANTSAFLLGSKAFDLSPTGATAMGDIRLPPGVLLTAHVQRANGTPLNGADFDFKRSTGTQEFFVPDDNTNALGNLTTIVPVGTLDIEVCPRLVDALPARALLGVPISTTTNLGTIVVPNGFQLFGTVLDAHGNPAFQADVDVFDAFTGVELPLCNDNTDANGAYSVYVPPGTYDVLFTPFGSEAPLGTDLHLGVVVSAPTLLDGQLRPYHRGRSSGPPQGR